MIQFAKVRNVKSPQRKLGDAGIDFFIPEYDGEICEYIENRNPRFVEACGLLDEEGITIPGETDVLIPSGVKYKIPQNVALVQFTKSGVGSKKNLDCFNGVGDASYQGELHIHLRNMNKFPVKVAWGEKIAQFVPVVYDISEVNCVETDEGFFTEKTERGEGGFGSTGI